MVGPFLQSFICAPGVPGVVSDGQSGLQALAAKVQGRVMAAYCGKRREMRGCFSNIPMVMSACFILFFCHCGGDGLGIIIRASPRIPP